MKRVRHLERKKLDIVKNVETKTKMGQVDNIAPTTQAQGEIEQVEPSKDKKKELDLTKNLRSNQQYKHW